MCTASAASLGLYLWLACRYPLAPSLANPRASWASQVEPTFIGLVGSILSSLPKIARVLPLIDVIHLGLPFTGYQPDRAFRLDHRQPRQAQPT